MSGIGTRSVHCIDAECDDCRSLTCSCICHGGESDEAIEADEFDDMYGWRDDDD